MTFAQSSIIKISLHSPVVDTKGMRVGIKGSLHVDIWTDKEQRERHSPRITVSSIEVLETQAEIALRSGESFNLRKGLNREAGADLQTTSHQAHQQKQHKKKQQTHSMDWLDDTKPKDEKITITSPSAGVPFKDLEDEKLPSFFDDF